MEVELKALQERVGITFVCVTHDQEEALTMSDRLAVMHHGRLLQVGTPEEIYTAPASAFVASFIGVSNNLPRPAQAIPGQRGGFPRHAPKRSGEHTSSIPSLPPHPFLPFLLKKKK